MTTTSRALPDGLLLRTAGPADLDQVGALLAERGEEVDALDHRLAVEDPDLGWEACAVVVEGDRVVSTALLLDETVRVGDVTVPAGQVELVATDRGHEGRGLVRALMGWAHERSEQRGHLLQVMIGIPYFYRLFGYEYAIDMPRARALTDGGRPSGGESAGPAGSIDAPRLRRATPADLPALAALQDAAQAPYDVAMPHPAARRRWLLEHDASSTWVVERDGVVVGSARKGPPGDGQVLVAEPAAADADAADLLLRAVVGRFPEATPRVVHRPLTATGRAWEHRLAPPGELAEQYYVRIGRPEVLLDALRPVLSSRLRAAGLDRREVLLSTFGRHYRMAVADDGALGPVAVGGPMQDPGAHGAAGVAPTHLADLLLGPLGMHGLARRRPDVYPGPDAELYEAVFPPLTADLLTYYLPW
jgi:predicted N-acetyltransferase YhbS